MLNSKSTLSSRSTLFSSKKSNLSSKSKKKKKKIKKDERIPLSEIEILAKNTIKDIIEHSIQIADFYIRHKKFQKIYENRKIKREQNFVTPDNQFSGNVPKEEKNKTWNLISKMLGKILHLESDGTFNIYDFNTNKNIALNLCEDNNQNIIISAELYEQEQISESSLYILYQNFIFVNIDLLLLFKESKNLHDKSQMANLISICKKCVFNCKPYLNIPNIEYYIPKYDNNIKIIIFPKMIKDYCTDIILNFTQISGKFLIYNTLSNSVIGNYFLKQEDYVTTESDYINKLRQLISVFMEKIWSTKQYEYLCVIINSICGLNEAEEEGKKQDKNILNDLKKLCLLLNMASNDEDDMLSLMMNTVQYTFTEIKGLKTEQERYINAEKLYSSIILPLYTKSKSDNCIISFEDLIIKIKIFFDKLYACSIAIGNSNLSLIQGKFKLYQILFLKCYNRGINLRQLFLDKDPNSNGYIDKNIAFEIFKNLPIGLTNPEIDIIMENFDIFDENKKYMYEYLFLLDEEFITKIAFSSPLNLLGDDKFTCGYFIKNNTTNNIEFNEKKLKNIKGKMSAPTEKDDTISMDSKYNIKNEFGNKIEEKGILYMTNKTRFSYEYLVDYMMNSFFNAEISDIIILTSYNLIFILTPFNENIPIFKANTKYSNKTQILEKIGEINLDSYYKVPPSILYYIEERNLLLTQRMTQNSTDIIFIDIGKDLVFPSRDKKKIEYTISDEDKNCKQIKNLLTFEKGIINIKKFKSIHFLRKNELLALESDDSIYIINPRSHKNELSLMMQEIKKTVYTTLCRQFCENPIEQTGDQKFKLLYKISLTKPLKKMSIFSLGNDLIGDEHYYQYSNTDWIYLLFDTGEICSYCVNRLCLDQKVKEIDSPLPEKDVEQLFSFSVNNMKKSLMKYKNYLDNVYKYYETNLKMKEESVDKLTLIIKDNMLYDKKIKMSINHFQLHSIHQLIYLFKMINLKFDTCQTFEIFPFLQFLKPKYESDANYFKTDLFPHDKNYEELGNEVENITLPKNKNTLKSDLSSLHTNLTVIDAIHKKLAKYILDKNIQNDQIFKNIDTTNEEILDFDQFEEGCKQQGLISKKYLTKDEIKILYYDMDDNHSNVLTLDEYSKYLEKVDIFSIKSLVEGEKEKRAKEQILDYDIESFVNSSEDEIKKILIPYIEKVQDFYSNIPYIEISDIQDNLDKLSEFIPKAEVESNFNYGIIFYEDFKNLILKYIPNIDELGLNHLFSFFDQNNMNLFIYVRDIVKYLKKDDNKTSNMYMSSSIQNNQKMTQEQFILIYIGIMKKILKLSIMELGISPENFSEKFILSKKYEKHTIILDYIPTEIIIEKLKKKITNFIPLEEKILFDYYIDIYNYGVLNDVTLKTIFDCLMKFINDTDVYDLTKFDTFAPENANKYINKQKYNLKKYEKELENNSLLTLLPIYDKTILEFAFHSQKKENYKNLTFLYNYLRTIGEEKEFLTHKEFMKFAKDIIPISSFNSRMVKNLISQLTENITLINEPTRPLISVSRIILFIVNAIKKVEALQPKINIQDLIFSDNTIIIENLKNCICRFSEYDSLMNEINCLSENYLKIINECKFSGLIIINKNEVINDIRNRLSGIELDIIDNNNYYMNLGNIKLISNFNKLLKRGLKQNKNIEPISYNYALPENFLSNIQIPRIKADVLDTKEMINLKRYQSGMIENFDFFQPELQCFVNITKIRKSFLERQISNDGQNLLDHIIQSLKLNHYLQQEYLKNSDTKTFDKFHYLRNFGIYTKEILINKALEEEFYIINEKVDIKEYVSLYNIAKSNGGLLYIPEIINTNMGMFIIKNWAKSTLDIINELNNLNRCFRYFNLKDFYTTLNCRKLKMTNLFSHSVYDDQGQMVVGPDIFKILLLLDRLTTGTEEELSMEILDNVYSNDAYIAPELIKKINQENPSNKVDSWLYGVLLFNFIFGVAPKSFFLELKNWSEIFMPDHSMDQLLNDDSFDVLNSSFFYNPFIGIKKIVEDKNYFIKVLQKKSFSAIIQTKNKNKDNKYDIWTFIDLINACLNIDPLKRPSISSMIKFDLFDIDIDPFFGNHRESLNILDYYSPENVIKDKMVLPLRAICCEILKNEELKPYEINNYQNFIFNVIRELNIYMFSKVYSSSSNSSKDSDSVSSTNQSYEDYQEQISNDNSEYKFKNSVIVKYVIQHKVVDLLIFLILKHFNANLVLFKEKIKQEKNNINDTLYQEEEKNSNLNYSKNKNNKSFKGKNAINSSLNYYKDLHNFCGKLISPLVDFLYNCVEALNSYDHVLSLYVEDVIIWILKLFIGEENQLLSLICDYRDSNDKLKKYILHRTFMRDENVVIEKDFQEDELDRIFSVFNANKQLFEYKSLWSPELHHYVNGLFREAFGENCSGSYKHRVIKNYFIVANSYYKNEKDSGDLIKNKTNELNFFGNSHDIKINYKFMNTEYVSELLSLIEIRDKLSNRQKNLSKILEIKKNALNYINIVFKSKKSAKIRGCLDCKIHLILQKSLYTSFNELSVKKELLKILKEISFSLVDINEIGWQFGNNFEKLYGTGQSKGKNNKILSVDLENCPYVNESSWDSNTSIIDFTYDILQYPHTFILNLSNKFLKVGSNQSLSNYNTYIKEFGYIFSSPIILKPLLCSLQKKNENLNIRLICLEILFNLLLSNEFKIISNLSMSITNFYEILVDIISSNNFGTSKNVSKSTSRKEDNFEIGEKEKYFTESVTKVIKIIIEMKNPDVKRQIFNCPVILKYMERNKLSFKPRLELVEIEDEFIKIKDLFNFDNLEGKISFLIDAFKCWLADTSPIIQNENLLKIRNIIQIIHHIFNNEWLSGLKNMKKNCLVFNMVKLFEWIVVQNNKEYLFPKNQESFTSKIIISFMTKIKENSEKMKKLALEINKMALVEKGGKDKYGINLFGNNVYNMNKIYNFISVKLLNIVYIIFSMRDNYYNAIFNKMKIGLLLSELFINQLEVLNIFLNQDNIDISILNNYITEVKIRLGFLEIISLLPKNLDEIKMQLLQSELINYIFKYMIDDNRKFKTNSKRVSLDFLSYKSIYPMKNESIAFLDIIFRRYYDVKKRTETDCFIFEEILRNVKVFHLIQNQLAFIKIKIKGDEVISILQFFNMVLRNGEREIIKIMNLENAKDYLIYALQNETSVKKKFPYILDYINKVQAGIEK